MSSIFFRQIGKAMSGETQSCCHFLELVTTMEAVSQPTARLFILPQTDLVVLQSTAMRGISGRLYVRTEHGCRHRPWELLMMAAWSAVLCRFRTDLLFFPQIEMISVHG